MKKAPKNRIAEQRKAKGMTQQQLADAVGAHWITISKLERGRIKLTTDWLERLAKPLGANAGDLLAGTSSQHYEPAFFGEPEGYFSGLFTAEKKRKSQGLLQFVVEGANYEPFLHPGDRISLVPLRHIDQKQRKNLEGRLCFCDFGTKASRPGFLYSGKKPNTYDLFWMSRRIATDASDAKIHVVTGISFGLRPT